MIHTHFCVGAIVHSEKRTSVAHTDYVRMYVCIWRVSHVCHMHTILELYCGMQREVATTAHLKNATLDYHILQHKFIALLA